MKGERSKLCPVSFGLAVGVLWGISLFLMALFSMFMDDWGHDFVKALGELYIGYGLSFGGSIMGLLWGFVDGFIGGFLLIWLYNFFSCMCCKLVGQKSKRKR